MIYCVLTKIKQATVDRLQAEEHMFSVFDKKVIKLLDVAALIVVEIDFVFEAFFSDDLSFGAGDVPEGFFPGVFVVGRLLLELCSAASFW
jgi:hypothetical protein